MATPIYQTKSEKKSLGGAVKERTMLLGASILGYHFYS